MQERVSNSRGTKEGGREAKNRVIVVEEEEKGKRGDGALL